MKRVVVNESYCIGCRLCEVHCLVAHSQSKHILKAFREESDSITPRIVLEQSGHTTFAVQCRHCDEAPCLDACMTGAMHRDLESGAVLCDEDRCVGCFMCIMVCPLGAILPGKTSQRPATGESPRPAEARKIASKCDLCGMDFQGEPPCVANCPNEALKYE